MAGKHSYRQDGWKKDIDDSISSILNPNGKYYNRLKKTINKEYEDNYWAEDAIFMERNSRDFVSRIERINVNAEAICQTLLASPVGRLEDQIQKKSY